MFSFLFFVHLCDQQTTALMTIIRQYFKNIIMKRMLQTVIGSFTKHLHMSKTDNSAHYYAIS
jgi:hypothetical protein